MGYVAKYIVFPVPRLLVSLGSTITITTILQPEKTLRSLHIIYIYYLIVLYGPAVFKTQGVVSPSGNRCDEVRSFTGSAGVQQVYPISYMKEGSLGAKSVTRSEVSCGRTNLGGSSHVRALPDVCDVRGLVAISDALVEQ